MRRGSRTDLRLAVECLPRHTRVAMLDGIRRNDIIAGAYTDRHGGVCPMLAAHRCGGRTDFLAFAKAWDRFTRAKRPRRATEREVAVLITMLEATLAAETDLGAAIADHQLAARRRRAREARRTGWDWLADAELEPGVPTAGRAVGVRTSALPDGLGDRFADLEPGLLEHDLRDRAAR